MPNFAQLTIDKRSIAERVLRQAAEECAAGACPVAPFLEACVAESVNQFADARIQTHIPTLALRRVRCCIRVGSCDCDPC